MNDQKQLDELCNLARQMGEAEKNCNQEFFNALLADKLTFRRANGAIVDKQMFLAGLRNPANTYETLEQRDVVARVYDDVGVVTLLVQTKGCAKESRSMGCFAIFASLYASGIRNRSGNCIRGST